MSGNFGKSVKIFIKLVRRTKLNREYKAKVAEYDREFLNKIIDPKYEGGRFYRMYHDGLQKIRSWFDVAQ